MGTTRFSGPMMYSGEGRTVASGTWFKNLPLQLNPDYVVQFEDFTGIAVDGTNDWTYSQLTSGTGAILADAVGGWYEIAGTGSDNTGASLQGNEIWQAEANKKLFFETRIVSTDADQMDIFVGLCENGTLATGVPFGTNNQIGFLVVDEARIFMRSVIVEEPRPRRIRALIWRTVLFLVAPSLVIVVWASW